MLGQDSKCSATWVKKNTNDKIESTERGTYEATVTTQPNTHGAPRPDEGNPKREAPPWLTLEAEQKLKF